MAMTRIEQCAARDAAADFAEGEGKHSTAEWFALAFRSRTGDHQPAAAPIAAVGIEHTCRSWGVDPAMWTVLSGRWMREYAVHYACALVTLANAQVGP